MSCPLLILLNEMKNKILAKDRVIILLKYNRIKDI